MSMFWLSFCKTDRPEGQQFVGACLVEAETELDAVAKTRELGINPGGEALILRSPDNPQLEGYARAHANKLMTLADVDAVFGVASMDDIPDDVPQTMICEEHNKTN